MDEGAPGTLASGAGAAPGTVTKVGASNSVVDCATLPAVAEAAPGRSTVGSGRGRVWATLGGESERGEDEVGIEDGGAGEGEVVAAEEAGYAEGAGSSGDNDVAGDGEATVAGAGPEVVVIEVSGAAVPAVDWAGVDGGEAGIAGELASPVADGDVTEGAVWGDALELDMGEAGADMEARADVEVVGEKAVDGTAAGEGLAVAGSRLVVTNGSGEAGGLGVVNLAAAVVGLDEAGEASGNPAGDNGAGGNEEPAGSEEPADNEDSTGTEEPAGNEDSAGSEEGAPLDGVGDAEAVRPGAAAGSPADVGVGTDGAAESDRDPGRSGA